MKNRPLIAALGLLCGLLAAPAMAQERVRGAHENQDAKATKDDLGITVPIPTSFPARRYPASHEFPTGPAIGERIPDFELPNQHGELIDFHADRGGEKAILVFYRSAVW